MNLRAYLALLLASSLVLLLAFIGFILYGAWGAPGPIIKAFASFDSTSIATYGPWLIYVVLFGLMNILIFVLLYILLDRIIVRPVRVITRAMSDFAVTQKLASLPPFSHSSKEMQAFAQSFVNFTANFEEVHAHDVEISRVKSDFISTAAHQLRTPLTGIRWALEALEKEQLTESQHALVASAVGKSHDLVAIVGTLLDISSIESGKHKYVFTSTDLRELVSSVTADFSLLAQKSNVAVYYKDSGEKLPKVRADREQIKWVLNNLVENAIRYTPAGGSVQIMTSSVPGRVLVRVRDTGIGITPKDRNNIFERFYRADNAIVKENAGNGLGLYIARTIATDHGGDLDFASNTEGPGTTFTLSLPTAE
ncbi:MAG: Two-component system, NarL family, sensor histidine kinase BarA [Parcubacteria group bacterium]|nr:Two-component system, NarL family, sensor histidine kinase BarA [Parcubacteria group bacterium]